MADFSLCPKYEKAFDLLGKRWNGLIIRTLLDGPKRFTDLSHTIPKLSGRVLAERFRELERQGIVERRVYPEIPVRIEYRLTPKGAALEPVLREVQNWADRWVKPEEL